MIQAGSLLCAPRKIHSLGHHLANVWNEEPWKWVGDGGFYCGECPHGFLASQRRSKVVVISIMLFGNWKEAAFPSFVQLVLVKTSVFVWCSVSLIFKTRAGRNIKVIFTYLRKIPFGMRWKNPKVKHKFYLFCLCFGIFVLGVLFCFFFFLYIFIFLNYYIFVWKYEQHLCLGKWINSG